MTTKFWSLLFATGLFMGCVGTDVGNPQDNSDEDELFVATDPALDTRAQGLTYRGVEIESAWVVVESVELKADCDEGAERIASEGPFVVDLLAPADTPIPLAHDGDEYCQMRLNFAPTKDDTGPDSLVGHWLAVEGTLADGSPFSVTATRSERIQFVGRSAPIGLEKEGIGLLANLSIVSWIEENLPENGSRVEVQDDTPGPLPNGLRVELRSRSRLFKDRDKNGRVDADAPAPVGLPEF